MSSYKIRPESIVNQIRNNLLDRYDSGYPILKELLQNADDAGAHRFRLDARAGWPNADNPLLRGPGLLIVNNGEFRSEDQEGILSFGESVKVANAAAIGKFGFGQKAVFHLCDAFAVHSFGQEQPFSDVVNPFEDVKVEGNVTGGWKTLTESDARRLREASADFHDRGLILWLPLRRDGLAPAPDAGFSSNRPTIEDTVQQMDKPDALRSLLTTLRHLRDVEIRKDGETRLAVRVLNGDRLLGPREWPDGARTFAGTIATRPGTSKEKFVAHEVTLRKGLEHLRRSDHWPRTHSALCSKPTPEKGEPHGAATLVRIAGRGSTLEIDWAVFLPVSEADRKSISVNGPDLGCFRLLLHGYFFLDSGRRRIEGLGSSATDDPPSDAAELRRAWNAELRDSAVLPLVPAVLLDALKGKLATSAELAAVTAALAADEWFIKNRYAICRNGDLARVLEATPAVTWRIVPNGTTIRPLPTSVGDHPERVQELFQDVHSWAGKRGVALCVDQAVALTAEPMRWTPEELGSLFMGLSSRAFSSRALAALLADFLDLAVHSGARRVEGTNDDHREAIGPHVVRVLRAALQGTAPLAPSEHVARILAHVPVTALFRLPTSVEHRHVLRAMAYCDAAREILPVRGVWVADAAQPSTISSQDVGAFLRALEPLIEAPDADSTGEHDRAAQAAMSALALLRAGGGPAVAVDSGFADARVLRGRESQTGKVLALSIQELAELSRQGLLFSASPKANEWLPLLVAAARDAKPVIIDDRKAAEYLETADRDGSGPKLREANKSTVLAIINSASRFGEESSRAELLERMQPDVDDDRQALRRLCAGNSTAGAESAELRLLSEASNGIERIVKEVFGRGNDRFLLPSRIAGVLSPRLRRHLGIEVLDEPRIEAVLDNELDTIPRLQPTESEREAFLLIDLPDSLLRRLPIHARSDGTVGDADGIYVEIETEWPIPAMLKQEIVSVQPCRNPKAHERQKKLIHHWSPTAQVETALRAARPHILRKQILDALAALSVPSGECALVTQLRETPWLAVDDAPVRPADVLALPPSVGEHASALLTTDEGIPAFVLADALPDDIEQHPGFQYVREHLLPDEDPSLAALARMIANAGLVGLVAPIDTEHAELVNDLATLAKSSADLALPAWSLLKAMLASLDPARDTVRDVVSSFRPLAANDHEPATRHIEALAALASDRASEPDGKAARQVYEHEFAEIAGWADDARRKVLGGTRVPTADGGWRTGREVVEEANGIAPTHVLEPNLARTLRKRRGGDAGGGAPTTAQASPHNPSRESSDAPPDARNHDGFIDVDLADLEAESAKEQRRFLAPWKGHDDLADLVIVYLALIGRYESMREVAQEWRSLGATTTVDAWWEELDTPMKPTRGGTGGPNPARVEIDQRRFRFREIAGKRVPVVSLSGDRFQAPLDADVSDIVVGNSHQAWHPLRDTDGKILRNAEGRCVSLIELHYRKIDPVGFSGNGQASTIFRRLVETVAIDCHRWGMSDARAALKDVLDKATRPGQTTLKDTKRLLRDRLPTILAEMKLPAGSACRRALQEYQSEEGRIGRLRSSNDSLDNLKIKLWEDIDNPKAAAELLSSARRRIEDLGYSANRVLFELFQNADDAYEQLDDPPERPAFRVEDLGTPPGVRVTHWGRLINHLGANADDGYRLGRDRDLINMLVMNFSEKPAEGDLTGKFGMGFKSVHLLSDSVGIASGSIALRTRGGLLSEEWPEGITAAESLRRDGRRATVIDVPFGPERAGEEREAFQAFRNASAWLPVFARRIRRIEIAGVDSKTLDCTVSPLPGQGGVGEIDVITVSTAARKQRALRFNLGEGYSLLLAVDRNGPCCFPNELKRVWNLAPLEEELRSGWLLNGPFAVDPGRGRLAGLVAARQQRFEKLGRGLGARLVELHDATEMDWKGVAEGLDLNTSAVGNRQRFREQLFDLLSQDFDDELARFLHARDRGYGRLAAERQAMPTGLPAPFDALVRASEVCHFTDGALTDSTVLAQVSHWAGLAELSGQLIGGQVTTRLKKLGFSGIRPVTMVCLLQCGLAEDGRVDASMAARFGKVVTLKAIEEEPLHQERKAILAAVRRAKFRAQDGAWRSVKNLNFESGGEDERLICGFASASALLHDSYQGVALEFFKVARSTSGYGPRADLLRTWADCADDKDRRRAVLRYIISGRHGRELARSMRGRLPAWVTRPFDDLRSDPLLDGWSEEDKKHLLIELGEHDSFIWQPPVPQPPVDRDAARRILRALHDWWVMNRDDERNKYSRRVYPESFSPGRLGNPDDRTSWFTMLALACFQSFGRAQDEQHRAFIDRGHREGWWPAIAKSRPPDKMEPWVERLEDWSAVDQFTQDFLLWKRTFVDLYTIARWLPVYVEITQTLPRKVRECGRPISLNDVLRPSYSSTVGPLGLNAAPINRSLGIGMNWLIRELARNGVYDLDDVKSMAPYCWMPSQRVRDLLGRLGMPDLSSHANKEDSRVIHNFIVKHLGEEHARFGGDFDLPLQLITRAGYRDVLDRCFQQGGLDAPHFDEDDADEPTGGDPA